MDGLEPPTWAVAPLAWAGFSAGPYPMALYHRRRYHRNFREFPFPRAATVAHADVVRRRVGKLLEEAGIRAFAAEIEDQGPQVARRLRERHLWPLAAPDGPPRPGASVLVAADLSASVLVHWNEHLSLGFLGAGLPGEGSGNLPPALAGRLADTEGWAYGSKWGFLCSDAAKTGAGFDLGCMLHLPALGLSGKIPMASRALQAVGMDFAIIGPASGTGIHGQLFWIQTRGGFGKEPEEIRGGLVDALVRVLEWEKETQGRLLAKHRAEVEDRIGRSARALREADSLAWPEFLERSSYLRLGAYLGLAPVGALEGLEALRIGLQASHLMAWAGIRGQEPGADPDALRALRLRSEPAWEAGAAGLGGQWPGPAAD